MSIVKMKRIQLIGLNGDKDVLLQKLMLLGCLEIREVATGGGSEPVAQLMHKQESDLPAQRQNLARLSSALDILQKYAPEKSGLFRNPEEVSAETLFSDSLVEPAMEAASAILAKEEQISRLHARISQMESSRTALGLWKGLDVPLETTGTGQAAVLFGTVPASADIGQLEQQLYAKVEAAQVFRAGQSKEQHCLMVVCHRSSLEETTGVLRECGFTQTVFTEQGTAGANIARLNGELDTVTAQITQLKSEIQALNARRSELRLCLDRVTQEVAKEEAKEKLMVSGAVFALEGWISAPEQEKLDALLDQYPCAYELYEPVQEEIEQQQVPIKLKGNKLTEPLNMVTEMYTMPSYDGIDPNGLIAPFFCMFFGIMYADLAYGLILLALGLLAKRKLKLKGTMKYMAGLLVLCGITTAVFGFLFGGFFGDVIPVFSETFLGREINLWALIDPLQNPMPIMIGACALGVVHLMVGMIVRIYMGFRDGEALDALLDVVPWWILFAGFAALALGYGGAVAIAGVICLVLTQGRHKPTLVGKLMGGITSLYDITSYLSDVLSYIRLMALLLATSVIASVFNILAAMPGNIIFFIVIFLIGHTFNMAVNIIGTYVHAARLQYLEFFGKFYKDGGKKFAPLDIKTKFHDVIEK